MVRSTHREVQPKPRVTRLTLLLPASNLRVLHGHVDAGCFKEKPMGDLGGGFWAAIITWTVVAIAAALVGLGLHMREKGQSE